MNLRTGGFLRRHMGSLRRRARQWPVALCAVLLAAALAGGCEEDSATAKAQAGEGPDTEYAGLPDPNFGANNDGQSVVDVAGAGLSSLAEDLKILSNGKILVAGTADTAGGLSDIMLARFNANGTLDTGFGTNGYALFDWDSDDDQGHALALQSSGKIIVVGQVFDTIASNYDMIVLRYTAAGALDTTFGSGGIVVESDTGGSAGEDIGWDVAVDSQDRIVVVGSTFSPGGGQDMVVWRFNANGALDAPAFATTGYFMYSSPGSNPDAARAVTIDANDRILVAGSSRNGASVFATVWALLDDGTLNTPSFDGDGLRTFPNAAGGTLDQFNGISVLGGGKIYLAGIAQQASTVDAGLVWRVANTAADDNSFGGATSRATIQGSTPRRVNDIQIDSAGRIYLVGEGPGTGTSDMYVWRFRSNGTLDPSYAAGLGYSFRDSSSGGTDTDIAYAAAIDASGKLVVAGHAERATGYTTALWRLLK